jgi:molybdopterin-containing oxidoreductase family iron-sulfur binding subunit
MHSSDPHPDLAEVRSRLASVSGPEYWRSLEELAQGPAFQELLEREFPQGAREWAGALDRRKFLALMGASLALAGVSGCAQAPTEHIIPYVRQPEGVVPGRPQFYATAMPLAGYATGGLLVESHLGRPTKVEGNPDHPWSPKPANSPEHARFGPSDLFAQASVLGLYDPDRSQTVRYRSTEIRSWESFRTALADAWQRLRGRDPDRPRLRILTGAVTSPTLLHQLRTLLPRFPRGWHQYEPSRLGNAYQGARLAFNLLAGRSVETHYRVDRAHVIVSLDSDFLACGAGHLRYARDFAARRQVRAGQDNGRVNRLYAVDSFPSVTGAKADHRVAIKSALVERFTLALASQLGVAAGRASPDGAFGLPAGWLRALADDLQTHRGRCLVVAGEGQSPAVTALAHAVNERLGNVGQTVMHTAPIGSDHLAASLEELADDMEQGHVEVLLVLGCNPVYSAPANLHFASHMERVGLRAHLGPYFDETAALCHWHVPEAHYLESWGDVRAHDGTVSLVQPLIAPLYRGRTASEVLLALTGQREQRAHEILRAHWRTVFDRGDGVREELAGYAGLGRGAEPARGDFEGWWRRALHDGFIAGTEAPPAQSVSVREDFAQALAGALRPAGADQLEIVFRPDPTLFDGSFANNGWLQELPKPVSHLTWGSAAFLSPRTAGRLGLARANDAGRVTAQQAAEANGKEVVLRLAGREVRAPVWVLPGHADDSVTVHLGGGRTRAGRVGNNVGFNAYGLRDTSQWGFATGLEVEATGRRVPMAATQTHHLMHGRDLVRSGNVQDYARIAERERHDSNPRRTVSLYPERPYDEGHQWGMSIDLNLCTGCKACVVACQAENNIPVVGKEEVLRGREMHWLRVDTYYTGDLLDARRLATYFQPVPCMHCENAPCELVCPVGATVHSDDGLNDMVYNRCVGTRYCSNNCPYKVRRFNFFQYADFHTEVLRLGRNPEVTVRSRGVMEKCTYCVQRIRQGEIEATVGDRNIRDGDIQTACQAACPAGAIVFGDLNQRSRDRQRRPLSLVAQLQDQPVNYGLLADLNTRPRTTYLWAFKNPNPAIERLERPPQPARG